jgi:hypothetical protein
MPLGCMNVADVVAENEAIKEIVEAVVGTLTCDTNGARFVPVR